MAEPEWKTPEIRAAEAQVEQSAQAVRELAEQFEREGLPRLADEESPAKPAKKDDDDGDGNIVLRHSSW
jgi:transposase